MNWHYVVIFKNYNLVGQVLPGSSFSLNSFCAWMFFMWCTAVLYRISSLTTGQDAKMPDSEQRQLQVSQLEQWKIQAGMTCSTCYCFPFPNMTDECFQIRSVYLWFWICFPLRGHQQWMFCPKFLRHYLNSIVKICWYEGTLLFSTLFNPFFCSKFRI